MPTYVYRCTKGHVFELFHSMSDDSPKRCPKCRSKAVRVPAAGAGLLFKGSGFYITDYRSKNYTEKAKTETAKSDTSGSSSGGDKKSDSGGKSTGEKKKSKKSGAS